MKTLTKKWLKRRDVCNAGLQWFENQKETNVKKIIQKLIKIKKFNWCNWLLTHIFDKDTNVKYAIFAAEQVLHIFEDMYPNDERPRKSLDVAKKYLKLKTQNTETADAANAAYAAYAAYAAAAAAAVDAAAAAAARSAADAATYAAIEAAPDANADAYAAAYAAADAAVDAAAAAANAAYAAVDAAVAAPAAAAANAAIEAAAAAVKKQLKIKIIEYGISLLK